MCVSTNPQTKYQIRFYLRRNHKLLLYAVFCNSFLVVYMQFFGFGGTFYHTQVQTSKVLGISQPKWAIHNRILIFATFDDLCIVETFNIIWSPSPGFPY